MKMAVIEVTPLDKGKREVLVNGVSIPDVMDVSVYIHPMETDSVTITIRADSFQSAENCHFRSIDKTVK